MAGIRRIHGVAPEKVKAARTKAINALVEPLGTKPIDARDRALLLIGFAGPLRRSELVGLDVADVTEDDNGLRLRVRRSKTDQEGETALVGVPYGSNQATCPVRAWRAWREAAALENGPAFRAVTRHGRISAKRLGDRALHEGTETEPAASSSRTERAGHQAAA